MNEAVSTAISLEAVVEPVTEVFFEGLNPLQWREVWQNLSASAQVRILDCLALSLSPHQLQELATEAV